MIGDLSRTAAPALAALLVACASPSAADPFAGRYRSISGADHDVMVVAPSSSSRWLLTLERIGRPSMPHPAGPLVEAEPRQIAAWFGARAPRTRCLVASAEAANPVLCSMPPGSSLRFRDKEIPALATGWMLLVPKQDGIDVTELVKG